MLVKGLCNLVLQSTIEVHTFMNMCYYIMHVTCYERWFATFASRRPAWRGCSVSLCLDTILIIKETSIFWLVALWLQAGLARLQPFFEPEGRPGGRELKGAEEAAKEARLKVGNVIEVTRFLVVLGRCSERAPWPERSLCFAYQIMQYRLTPRFHRNHGGRANRFVIVQLQPPDTLSSSMQSIVTQIWENWTPEQDAAEAGEEDEGDLNGAAAPSGTPAAGTSGTVGGGWAAKAAGSGGAAASSGAGAAGAFAEPRVLYMPCIVCSARCWLVMAMRWRLPVS